MIDLNKYFSTNQDESKTDFFPLMSNEDEEKIGKESTPNTLAILPLKKYCFVSRCHNSDNDRQGQIN